MGPGKQEAFKDTSLNVAQEMVCSCGDIQWTAGTSPDSTIDEMRMDTHSFVPIDCDIYQPVIEGLRFFWPRMNPDIRP